MIAPFRFDRTFDFDVPLATLWDRLQDVERFPEWWGWLRAFDTEPQRNGLAPGLRADCVIRGPVPYDLRVAIEVVKVVPQVSIETSVDGDLRGPARLEVVGHDDQRSQARLTWEVEVIDPALRAMARVARPVLSWGHDVVVARGVRQFRVRALDPD